MNPEEPIKIHLEVNFICLLANVEFAVVQMLFAISNKSKLFTKTSFKNDKNRELMLAILTSTPINLVIQSHQEAQSLDAEYFR